MKKGESLATIHYNADAKLGEAKAMVAASYFIAPEAPRETSPLIRRIIGEETV